MRGGTRSALQFLLTSSRAARVVRGLAGMRCRRRCRGSRVGCGVRGCGGVCVGRWKSPPVSGTHCHWLVLGGLAWQGLREPACSRPARPGVLQKPPPAPSGHPQGVSPAAALIRAEAGLLCAPDLRIPAVHLGLWGRQQLRTHLAHPERS